MILQKYGLSNIFWIAMGFSYIFLGVAVYAIITLPENTFDGDNPEQVLAAAKLTYVRLSLAIICMVGYPVLLFKSLNAAKYVTIALTAWAIAIYIDDYLVLYEIITYPERGIVVFIQIIRPFFLVCLLWMSFELTFRNPDPD
ncbi:hypothetical protein NIG5292_02847 [Nereida ignava]|uniref:Uncharacterized protein n=1 Tax=Nereida ignava TaxID=282199 RepID=A0A0U1NPT3_9RHOB|nr:hypothetical protein [Nereida ignava]CRK76780.1 hypothetical protein NIG5292_02847 [Nereida ignava]SFJ64165.1 hypothetical protein SAMN02745667_01900 [Nereida ignava DSM 16309]